MDMALIAQAATLESRIPFVHFFDGFRTSHEVAKVEQLTPDDLRAMIDDDLVRAHRARALTPDRPVLRGTAQNPDVYFQAREAVQLVTTIACPDHRAERHGPVRRAHRPPVSPVRLLRRPRCRARHHHDGLGRRSRRRGRGRPATPRGEKVGLLKVRLFRPFSVDSLRRSAARHRQIHRRPRPHQGTRQPPASRSICDVVTALAEIGDCRPAQRHRRTLRPRLQGIHSRHGARASSTNCSSPRPQNHFTVGINDDVTHPSLDYDPDFSTEDPGTVRALFYGLGADGTVGANKNSIKIIGEETDNFAQGYFVYDSKKSGAMTISHLRFGAKPIRSSYLITRANFVACHQFSFLERLDMLKSPNPAPPSCSTAPSARTRSGTTCPRRCSSRSSTRS